MIIYTRNITDQEQRILEHDLKNIEQWVDGMIAGKINECAKRLAKDLAIKKQADLITEAFQDATYKNREQRERDNGTDKTSRPS